MKNLIKLTGFTAIAAVVVLVFALFVTGCGNDDDNKSNVPSTIELFAAIWNKGETWNSGYVIKLSDITNVRPGINGTLDFTISGNSDKDLKYFNLQLCQNINESYSYVGGSPRANVSKNFTSYPFTVSIWSNYDPQHEIYVQLINTFWQTEGENYESGERGNVPDRTVAATIYNFSIKYIPPAGYGSGDPGGSGDPDTDGPGSGGNPPGNNINTGISAINGIAYGNGKYVAVGESSEGQTIAYSLDGITWTATASNPFSNMINKVAWGADKFVAAGSERIGTSVTGVIAYSTDGETWTVAADKDSVVGNRLTKDIAWGDDKFVVVCSLTNNSSSMVYSDDGETWTAVPSTSAVFNSIDWCNDKFLAHTNNNMAYSTDGLTWVNAANDPFGTTAVNDYAWGNGKYVAVSTGKTAYSSDANNWTGVNSSYIIYAVAYGAGKFVTGGTAGYLAHSINGEAWTAVDTNAFKYNDPIIGPVNIVINDIVWGNGKFVAVGNASRIAYSADGINWIAVADSKFP